MNSTANIEPLDPKDQLRFEQRQAREKAKAERRLNRRPQNKMTLEQALELAHSIENERNELIAYLNTIPEDVLKQVEEKTGMWVRVQFTQDHQYTTTKLLKILNAVAEEIE